MGSYEKEFGESKALTSFIGALLIGCTLLCGPFAGGLLNKFNARVVVIAGSLIAAFGFFASTFAPNIFLHLVFYGFIGGVGFSLIYLPGIVVVSQYFEAKRALATGISVSGSGFGTFLMPVVCKFLIESKSQTNVPSPTTKRSSIFLEFSWRIAIYVSSLAILLCGVSGFFLKPIGIKQPRARKPSFKQCLQELLKRISFSKKQGSPVGI